jgi:hypothetical protein
VNLSFPIPSRQETTAGPNAEMNFVARSDIRGCRKSGGEISQCRKDKLGGTLVSCTVDAGGGYFLLVNYSGLSLCHCTMVCRGFVIMSCQCFVSDAPEPFLPGILEHKFSLLHIFLYSLRITIYKKKFIFEPNL